MAAVWVPPGRQTFDDPNGGFLSFGTVEMYIPSTTTPKSTWMDEGQTSLNTEPITLDVAGQCQIWGEGLYRQILRRQNGDLIWDLVVGFEANSGVPGSGTVTSVNVSGAATGLSFVGGPIVGSGTITMGGVLNVSNGGTGATTAPLARAALGLAIGADVQAYSTNLGALAGVTSAADKLFYFTGAGTGAVTDLTTYFRTVLAAADAPTARNTLGAEPSGQVLSINTQTASYILSIGDAGQVVEMNVGSANTLTVPPNSSVAFPVKTRVDLVQIGAGQTTITPGLGVTLRAYGGAFKFQGQNAGASIYQRAVDDWVVIGNLVP